MAYYDYPNYPGNPNPWYEDYPWYGGYGSNDASYMREMPMPPMPPMPGPVPPMPCPEPIPPMPCPEPPTPPMPCPEPPTPPMPCPKPPMPQPCPKPPTPPMPCPKPPVPKPCPKPHECPQPDMDYYTYPSNLEDALHLIEEAVKGEKHDVMFYECLMKMAPAEDRKIIEGVMADEKKHGQLLRTIYCEITGHTLPAASQKEVQPPKSYCDGIQDALYDEWKAMEKYRKILYAMQSRRHINMLTEIITDEMKHADKLTYLYTRNECWEKCSPRK